MAASSWTETKYTTFNEFRKLYTRSFCIKSQLIPHLPSAIAMFKILQAFHSDNVLVIKKFHNKIQYHLGTYDITESNEMVLFTFESEAAMGEFEQNIIREMGIYIAGNPPPYVDEQPKEI